MPDNSPSSSTPEAQAAADELNLVNSGVDKPRLKRRSLKMRSTAPDAVRSATTDKSADPAPLPDSPRAEYPRPDAPRPEPPLKGASSIPAAKPAAGNPYTSTPNPAPSAQSLPTTPLYYTSGTPKKKEDASAFMKTASSPASSSSAASSSPAATPQPSQNPAASSASPVRSPAAASAASPMRSAQPSSANAAARPAQASSHAVSPTRPAAAAAPSTTTSRPAESSGASSTNSQARPATSTPASAATSSATRATAAPTTSISSPAPRSSGASANDFRANVERQSREQKSVGGIIAMIVYGLVGVFILGAILALYGGYVITKQIHQQSVTMTDLDTRYSAANQALTAQLKASNDSLTDALSQAQGQLKRQQELLARQQDTLNKLINADDAAAVALRQERQTRAAETATLKARVRILEEQRYSSANRP